MLALLVLLQSRRVWPGPALAERLDVSSRTLRRDIDRLRELGYRIAAVKGPDGGYRLEGGSELPPLVFDEEQAVALAVALQAAASLGAGIGDAAARALATVRQVMPSRLRHRIDLLSVSVLPSVGSAAAAADPRVLLAIGAAAKAREVLRFDYAPRAGGSSESAERRRVEPHHLLAHHGRWYLLGWDLERDDWRMFRVDRVAPRTPNGPRFVPRPVPGGDPRAFVAARFKGSDGANGWPCNGEVVLELPADAVLPFVGDGVVESLGPDRCRVSMGSWSWIGLATSIGRFDAPIADVRPAELAGAFAHLARRFSSAATSGPLATSEEEPGGPTSTDAMSASAASAAGGRG